MASIFCNRCGHRNPEGSNFCSSCGAVLEHPEEGGDATVSTITLAPVEAAGDVAEEDVTVAVDDLPPEMGMLVVKRGPNAGSRFMLGNGTTTVGRHPDSDIFLDDVTVSRRHAEIVHEGRQFVVSDVGSLNGTYVNRERIDDKVAIHSGDEVQIGKFKLVFLFEVRGR